MIRIALLSLGASVVFVGFALPFYIPAATGFVAAAATAALGCAAIRFAERRTKARLAEDSAWNRLMKVEGGELLSSGRGD